MLKSGTQALGPILEQRMRRFEAIGWCLSQVFTCVSSLISPLIPKPDFAPAPERMI